MLYMLIISKLAEANALNEGLCGDEFFAQYQYGTVRRFLANEARFLVSPTSSAIIGPPLRPLYDCGTPN